MSNDLFPAELRLKLLFDKQFSDDCKKLSDSVNMHMLAGNAGQFAAYKLQDVSTNNTVYPNRKEAVRILWPNQDYYFFVWVPPGGMDLLEAATYLQYNRDLYEAGMKMPDPDDAVSPDSIPTMPNTKEDAARQIRLLTK
jgi:hypothetical protein